jgi:hypothetical protein
MSNGIIVQPIALFGKILAVAGSVSVDSAFPITALFDPQPKTIVQTQPTGAGSYNLIIDFDLGADMQIDTIAVLFTNLQPGAAWQLSAATQAQGAAYLATVPANFVSTSFGVLPINTPSRQHGIWAGSAITMRFLRINLVAPASNERVLRIGNIVIGARVPLAWNFELGSGRKIEDQSIIRTLPGGETSAERGGRTPLFRATWSNIADTEMRAIYALLLDLGTSAPLLIVEDPDLTAGLNERIHYGLLTGLDFTERSQEDKQRIDLTIREMI